MSGWGFPTSALSYAIEYEAIKMSRRHKTKMSTTDSGDLNAISTDSRFVQLQNQMHQLMEHVKKSNFTDEKPSIDKSNIVCRFCKCVGHYKSDCEKLKAKQERENAKNFESEKLEKFKYDILNDLKMFLSQNGQSASTASVQKTMSNQGNW